MYVQTASRPFVGWVLTTCDQQPKFTTGRELVWDSGLGCGEGLSPTSPITAKKLRLVPVPGGDKVIESVSPGSRVLPVR